jgi:hypothetical protein
MKRLGLMFLGCASLLALLAPAASFAATDFGSNLAAPWDSTEGCDDGCSIFNTALSDPDKVIGPRAPVSGVVTSFTLKKGTEPAGKHWPQVRLRDVRSPMADYYQGLAAGPAVRPTETPGEETFLTRLAITQGDYLSLDTIPEAGADVPAIGGNGTSAYASGYLLPSGGPAVHRNSYSNEALLLQAHVEADADGDGFGDETQDLCPSQAGTQGACVKKCKKKKHKHRSASAAKKKKCKKHKKK